MFKILLMDRRPRLELTFKINFKTYLNAETESVNDENKIKILLPELAAFDLLIIEPTQFQKKVIEMILDEIETQGLGTAIVWLGENEFSRDDDLTLSLVPAVKELLFKSSTILHITSEQMASLEVPEFYPFPKEVLVHLIYLPCDVYHEIDGKMELIINKGGFLRSKEIKKLNQGFDKFFVKANERLNLTNSFTEQFMHLKQAFKAKKVDIDERLRMIDNAMDYFSAEFSREGMTDEVIDMARDCIDSLLNLCKEFDMADDLQNKLLGEEFSIQLIYAQVIVFISTHSSKLLGWIFEDPERSLATAAFFHDLSLKSDKESSIRTDEVCENSGFDSLSKERVQNHAHVMASFLKQNKFTPDESIQIVKEHHGSKNGRGFNKNIESVSNISKVFIIAEEWAHIIFNPSKEKTFNKSIALENLRIKYPHDEFMQIIDTLVFLDAKELDEVYLYHKKIEEEDIPTLDDVAELVEGEEISESALQDIKGLKFYMNKVEDVLASNEKLNENEKRVLKEVSDVITEFCQMIEGSSRNPDNFKTLIPNFTDKISTVFGKIEAKEEEFNEVIESARKKTLTGKTDLMIAISTNDEHRVAKLIQKSSTVNLNRPDRKGKHAIHFAAIVGNVKVIEMLIKAGAKINVVDSMRRSPLFHAVQNDNTQAYYFLVQNGARPNQQALGGVNLAMISAFRGNLKILENLIKEHGINKSSADMKGKGVEHYAKKGGHKEVIEFLNSL